MVDDALIEALEKRLHAGQRLTVMSGAGISAESGIPTFRGPEGYWTVGAQVYHPQEMATRAMFERAPDRVWQWYLYRMGVCRRAAPNDGHRAVVRLEELLCDRFTLITQNVDGLHLRAGSSPARTYQIHGNIEANVFTRLALTGGGGFFVRQPSTVALPALADAVARAL